jgi:hypothetical protein
MTADCPVPSAAPDELAVRLARVGLPARGAHDRQAGLSGRLQWLRARRTPTRLEATGPVGHAVNLAVFLVLYLLEPTSDAALSFYGASMWLAALRGDTGCEVLAVSNWLLHRDDQVGCALFWPVDQLEHHRTGRRQA